MNSNRRRGSARSTSDPPPPGPWALAQPSASPVVIAGSGGAVDAADHHPSRPTLHIDTQPPQARRGRALKREKIDSAGVPPIERHAAPPPVEAGLDPITIPGRSTKSKRTADAPPPINITVNAAPAPPTANGATPTISPFAPRYAHYTIGGGAGASGQHAPPPSSHPNANVNGMPTFWIPFTLAPGSVPGSMARLTPINRRVPAHLRAAASALNLKMMYPAPAPGSVPPPNSLSNSNPNSHSHSHVHSNPFDSLGVPANPAPTAASSAERASGSVSSPRSRNGGYGTRESRRSKLDVTTTSATAAAATTPTTKLRTRAEEKRLSSSLEVPAPALESRPPPPTEEREHEVELPTVKVEAEAEEHDVEEVEVVAPRDEEREEVTEESGVPEPGDIIVDVEPIVVVVPAEMEMKTTFTPMVVDPDLPTNDNLAEELQHQHEEEHEQEQEQEQEHGEGQEEEHPHECEHEHEHEHEHECECEGEDPVTILPEHCIIATSLPSAVPSHDVDEVIHEETEAEAEVKVEGSNEQAEVDASFEGAPAAAEDVAENEVKAAEEEAPLPQPELVLEQPFEAHDAEESDGSDDYAVDDTAENHVEPQVEKPHSPEETEESQVPPANEVEVAPEVAVDAPSVPPAVEAEPVAQVPNPEPAQRRPPRPKLTIRTSSTTSTSSLPLAMPAPPPSQNSTAYSTIRNRPSSVASSSDPDSKANARRKKQRSSLRQPLDLMADDVAGPPVESSHNAETHLHPPKAFVGAPRARSNTAVDAHLPITHTQQHSTTVKTTSHTTGTSTAQRPQNASRPAAMRKVHAQLAAQKPAIDSVHGDAELDTDGEPSWAWDELIRQLDEEDELKSKLRTYYKPTTGADGSSSTNVDAWWIAFQLAWEANMLRNRGVRTWWDIERHWRPSDLVFDDDVDGEAEVEAEANLDDKEDESVSNPVVAEQPEAKEKTSANSGANRGGEETLVSSPEHSPRRSDSRNSLKTLAGPNTNQSKRGTAPAAATSSSGKKAQANIPEESAGHTTPTSISSSISSLSSSVSSSSHPDSLPSAPLPQESTVPPVETKADPSKTKSKQQKRSDEPFLSNADFRNMWEEAEACWAKEDEEKSVPPPEKKPAEPQAKVASAEERERGRDRTREERVQRDRANTATAANPRPPILQRETYAATGEANAISSSQQDQPQPQSTRPGMFARRQSEPTVSVAPEASGSSSSGSGSGEAAADSERRGRNVRPKLHIDTDLTDYTKSKPRVVPPPRAQPSRPQAQPHSQYAEQPKAHSQSRPYPQTHSQAKPQSRSTNSNSVPRPAPPPVILRAIPQRAPSRIALAWKDYESRWESMLSLTSRDLISFSSLPWPVLQPPTAYTSNPADPATEGDGLNALSTLAIAQFLLSPEHSIRVPTRERLRGAIRRWHSDKFSRFEKRMRGKGDEEVGEGEEKRRIMEGVGVVARALTQLLELERGD